MKAKITHIGEVSYFLQTFPVTVELGVSAYHDASVRVGMEADIIFNAIHASDILSPQIGSAAKPPLGVMPERIWKETRAWDLIGSIARQAERDKGNSTPVSAVVYDWVEELRKLLDDLYVKHA